MILFKKKKQLGLLIIVIINCQLALAQISGNVNICYNQPNLYTNFTTAATYSWSSSPSFNTTITSPTSQNTNFISMATMPTTYTLYCTTTAPNNTFSLIINNNSPVAPNGSGIIVCDGDAINLNATGGTPTIQWFNVPSGGTSLFSGNTYNPGALTPGVYNYYIETSSAGCSSTRNLIGATVHNLPFTTIIGGNTSICQGASENLSVTASGGGGSYSYNWTPAGTLSTPTASNTLATPLSTTVYSINVIDGNGCTAPTNTTQITVNPLPSVSTSVSGTLTCSSPTQSLIATAVPTSVAYSWSGPGIVSGASTANAAVNQPGTYNATVTNTISGCSSNATVSVSQNITTPTITVNSVTICAGSSFTLTASGASTYTWSSSQTTSSIVITPVVNTNYTVTGQSAINGCTNTAVSAVIVNPLPTVNISGPTTICAGSSSTLIASGANTYAWTTSETTPSIVVSPTLTTSYTVTGISAIGCQNTSNIVVNVIASKQISGISTSTIGAVNGEVTLYKFSPILSKWDSVTTVNFSPNFNFGQLDSASYVIRATPSATNIQTTYGNSSISWQDATVINHGCTANFTQTITLIPFANIGAGTGSMSGTLTQTLGFGQKPNEVTETLAPLAPGNPIGGIIVKGGKNPGGNMFTQTETDPATGTFTLANIPNTLPGESIFIFIDIPGLDTAGTYYRVFNGGESYTGLNFVVDSAKIRPTGNSTIDVGITKNDFETSLTIYPNPAKDYFTLGYTLTQNADVKIEVLDVLGKIIATEYQQTHQNFGAHSKTISTKEFNSGIYFVKLSINQKQMIKKIIINK